MLLSKYITREVKIGVLFIVSAALLFFVLNFLKGVNIFNPTNYYLASYSDIDGLTESCPVFIRGHKVGQISKIEYDFTKEKPFIITLDINKDIQLPKGTTSDLIDNGLMGGKAIALTYAPYTGVFQERGDMLISQVTENMVTKISNSLIPKIDHLLSTTDSLINSVRRITDGKQMQNSLTSIERATADFEVSSEELRKVMKNNVPKIMTNVQTASADFAVIGQNVKKIDFQKTVNNIDSTMAELNTAANKINTNEGSLGLLINDKTLYNNLKNVSFNADQLMIDLKQNPKRYVHFSVFPYKEKKQNIQAK